MLLVPWTAVVIAVAPSILNSKRCHVFCAAATAHEEAYLASVCLGRISGRYCIECLFNKLLIGCLVGVCIIGMPISQVHDWKTYFARALLGSLCLMLLLLLEPRKIQKILKNLCQNTIFGSQNALN